MSVLPFAIARLVKIAMILPSVATKQAWRLLRQVLEIDYGSKRFPTLFPSRQELFEIAFLES